MLWEEIKLHSFSRAFTSIYMLALCILFTNTQLNILGRSIYLDSIPSCYESMPAFSLDSDTERQFLTFSWFLLNKSWITCRDMVDEAVNSVFMGWVEKH